MSKKAKTEEVKKEALTWTVSDDMMSIKLSDGRTGHASDSDVDCARCIFDKFCGASDCAEAFNSASLVCVMSARKESPLPKNIIWVEDVAATTPEDAEKFYAENKADLSEAIPPVALEQVEAKRPEEGSVEIVALSLIDESPYQVRTVDVESESFKELAASVAAQGLINPITVRFVPAAGRYELIAGHRRFKACEVSGRITAPCYVLRVSDCQAEAMTCCENLNREDLLPIDEALTVKAMLDHGRSREEIAKITGKSTRWVYRREAAARIGELWIQLAKTHKLSSKFLELLGSIDQDMRDQALEVVESRPEILDNGGNISTLKWDIGARRRELRCAPWSDEFPEYCADCKKRSDTCQSIEAGEHEDPWCMDGECWKRFAQAYPDAIMERYREQGVSVRELSADLDDNDLDMMDLQSERDENYDVCMVRREDEAHDFQIFWGRSKPVANRKEEKPVDHKPTEQNIFERAYIEEVMARIEKIISRPSDTPSDLLLFKRLTAAAISCGMDTVAPKGAQNWQSPNRASKCTSWMMEDGFGANDVLEALASCVLSGAVSKLRIYNPMDTSSGYIYAQAYVMAFDMVPAEVHTAAMARIPKKGKAKRK